MYVLHVFFKTFLSFMFIRVISFTLSFWSTTRPKSGLVCLALFFWNALGSGSQPGFSPPLFHEFANSPLGTTTKPRFLSVPEGFPTITGLLPHLLGLS